MNLRSDRSTVVHNVELPPLSQLDLEVLKNLPPEIMSEMNEMYKGELQGLVDTLNSDKGKENSSKSLALPAVTCNSVPGDAKLQRYRDQKDNMHSEEEHTKVSFVTGNKVVLEVFKQSASTRFSYVTFSSSYFKPVSHYSNFTVTPVGKI